MGVFEGPACENGNGTPWVGLAHAHFQNSQKFGGFTVCRGSGAHTGRAIAIVLAGAAHRWVEVMEGSTGAPLAVNF